MIAVRGGWAQKEHVQAEECVDSKLAVVRHSAGYSSTVRPKGSDLSEMHPRNTESRSLQPEVMMSYKQQSYTRPVTEMIHPTDEKFAPKQVRYDFNWPGHWPWEEPDRSGANVDTWKISAVYHN